MQGHRVEQYQVAAEHNQRRLRGYPKEAHKEKFLQAHKEKLCVVGTKSSPCLVPGEPSALTTSWQHRAAPKGVPCSPELFCSPVLGYLVPPVPVVLPPVPPNSSKKL